MASSGRQKAWCNMEILCDKRCIIGEGPVWNAAEEKLYHINGAEKEIRILDLDTKELTVRKLDFGIAALAFGKKGEVLFSCWAGVFRLNDDGSRTLLYDPAKYEILYGNDAKVGPDGRFYVGTQSRRRMKLGEEIDGKLYCIDADGEVKVLLDGLRISNGFDWSMDARRFYHTDSDTHTIKEYAYDKNGPSLTYTGRQVKVPGVDGFTIDQKDRLYVACWGERRIAVVDTKTMEIVDSLDVPARIPASCCFAGKAMDQLVVVTAAWNSDFSEDPKAGYTFVQKTKTKGRLPFLFG